MKSLNSRSIKVVEVGNGKEFCLGLAEITVPDKKSLVFQLVDDYAVWFVTKR